MNVPKTLFTEILMRKMSQSEMEELLETYDEAKITHPFRNGNVPAQYMRWLEAYSDGMSIAQIARKEGLKHSKVFGAVRTAALHKVLNETKF